MPANNPLDQNALPVQGPGTSGNEGWPIATVPAPGADPWPVTSSVAQEDSGTGTLTNAGTIITIDVRGMETLTAQFFGSAISQRIDFRASHDWPTENDLVGAVLLGFGGGPWTFIDPAIFYDGAIYVLPVAGLNEVRLMPVGALGTTLTVHWRLSPLPNAVNVASFVSPPYWNLGLSTTLPANPYEATSIDYANVLVQRTVPYVWNGTIPEILRAAEEALGTAGAGLLGVGNLYRNTAGNWQAAPDQNTVTWGGVTYPILQARISASASGPTQVVAAVATRLITVLAWNYVVNGAVSVSWLSDAANILGPQAYSATGGNEASRIPHSSLIKTGVNEDLNISLSAAVVVEGVISYIEEVP